MWTLLLRFPEWLVGLLAFVNHDVLLSQARRVGGGGREKHHSSKNMVQVIFHIKDLFQNIKPAVFFALQADTSCFSGFFFSVVGSSPTY